MAKATKVRISKCYLVEICDKDGNELDSEYTFVSYQDAKKLGQQLKNEYNKKPT